MSNLDDVVSLEIGGRRFSRWTQYNFNSDFLTPTDGFTFEVGGDAITDELIKTVKPGIPVKLYINDLVQSSGYLDAVIPISDRTGGSVITLHGRDTLSPVVDSQIDPRKTYPESQSLDKFLIDVLKPYGFESFEIDNERNVTLSAGKALKTKHRRRKAKPLNDYKLRSSKPQNNEAVFTFVSRITQRFGLWIWVTADGKSIVVSNPDFDQPARYRIINRRSNTTQNNIIRGGVSRDSTDQPSFIVARGNVPGSTYEKSITSVVLANLLDPVIAKQIHDAGLQPIIEVFKSYSVEKETVVVPAAPITIQNEFAGLAARPIYLKDDHSRTLDEFKRFAMREMSLRQRKAIVGRYEVIGHSQNGSPWQVDTVVDVIDELSNWAKPMWIKSRTFSKSRSGGTTTSLELLPLHTLSF